MSAWATRHNIIPHQTNNLSTWYNKPILPAFYSTKFHSNSKPGRLHALHTLYRFSSILEMLQTWRAKLLNLTITVCHFPGYCFGRVHAAASCEGFAPGPTQKGFNRHLVQDIYLQNNMNLAMHECINANRYNTFTPKCNLYMCFQYLLAPFPAKNDFTPVDSALPNSANLWFLACGGLGWR